MDHVTITTPFSGKFVVGVLGLVAIKQCAKFESSTFTHYKDIKGNKNAAIGVFSG